MQQVDLVRAADDAVLAFWREVEVQTRRSAAVDHRVIVDLERRGLAGLGAYASTAALARDVLRIVPGEATALVHAAHRLGPRHLPSQPVLPEQYPDTAQAVQAGKISARHAAVVTRAVDQLPDEVVDELGGWVQSHLLEQARVADPMLLARYATSRIDRLDHRTAGTGSWTTSSSAASCGWSIVRMAVAAWRATAPPRPPSSCGCSSTRWPHPDPNPTRRRIRAQPGRGAMMRCWSWSSWLCAPGNCRTRAR